MNPVVNVSYLGERKKKKKERNGKKVSGIHTETSSEGKFDATFRRNNYIVLLLLCFDQYPRDILQLDIDAFDVSTDFHQWSSLA